MSRSSRGARRRQSKVLKRKRKKRTRHPEPWKVTRYKGKTSSDGILSFKDNKIFIGGKLAIKLKAIKLHRLNWD